MSPLVVLVGPPGAGKSSVAALRRSDARVVARDTDADVEQQAGTDVADIFVDHGEAHFRGLERAAVARALRQTDRYGSGQQGRSSTQSPETHSGRTG